MHSETEIDPLSDFFRTFPSEGDARDYFEMLRWAGHLSCPHCESGSVASITSMKPMPYRCRECRQHFSVRTGTILAESRISLHKWLMAVYMVTTARKVIPTIHLARELGVTRKSAWFIAQRIREAFGGFAFDSDNCASDSADGVITDVKGKHDHEKY